MKYSNNPSDWFFYVIDGDKEKSYNTFVLESFFCEKGIISLIENR